MLPWREEWDKLSGSHVGDRLKNSWHFNGYSKLFLDAVVKFMLTLSAQRL